MTQIGVEDSGPFGKGGDRPAALEMEFFGTLGSDFIAFATARAARLDLKGWISEGGNRVIAHVEGPEALIGAFEMACSIGPDQVAVEDWTCKDVDAERGLTGFARRET